MEYVDLKKKKKPVSALQVPNLSKFRLKLPILQLILQWTWLRNAKNSN